MLNTSEQPQAIDERRILPVEAYGLKMISMGLLNPGDRPMIWRGPMLHSVIQQFLRSVQWGQLERSEEHTSELQSRPHLVCRLLLEKKKTSRGTNVEHAG